MSRLILSSTPSSIVSDSARQLLAKIIMPLGMEIQEVKRFVIYDDKLVLATALQCFVFQKLEGQGRFEVLVNKNACDEADQAVEQAIEQLRHLFD